MHIKRKTTFMSPLFMFAKKREGEREREGGDSLYGCIFPHLCRSTFVRCESERERERDHIRPMHQMLLHNILPFSPFPAEKKCPMGGGRLEKSHIFPPFPFPLPVAAAAAQSINLLHGSLTQNTLQH